MGKDARIRTEKNPIKKHLRRLLDLWLPERDFFITTCVAGRRPILAVSEVVALFVEEWENSLRRYGWAIGPYVVMPDHVHFFCRDIEQATPLSLCIGKWKEWTTKRLATERSFEVPVWQREFFDHLFRSDESYKAKWEYIRLNPVRAKLVARAEDWPHQGHVHYK